MKIRDLFTIFCAFVFLCASLPCRAAGDSEMIVTEATCAEEGTVIFYDDEDGTQTLLSVTPALGHSFGEWTVEGNAQVRVCTRCGLEEHHELTEPVRIELTGSMEGIGKKQIVSMPVHFEGLGESFDCYAFLSLQGHSTIDLDKKNYTLRLYDDADMTEKHKIRLNGWQKEHKYILKACMQDATACRNLIAADVWAEMTGSRAGVHPRLPETSHNGAVAGVPATVWLNGEFLGLYNLNLHKDNDLYGMQFDSPTAVIIANRQSCDESLFMAETPLDDSLYDWELEYCGTEDTAWAADSFNRLIRFVMTASDEEFRTDLSRYLDVNGAIDYLIFIAAMGLKTNCAKDMVLITYDGELWIPTAYDLDDAFTEPFIPEKTASGWVTGTGSLLWDRLMNLFTGEIISRYHELRQSTLSSVSLTERVSDYILSIPPRYYEMDAALYPGRGKADAGIDEITEFISGNLGMLDTVWEEE